MFLGVVAIRATVWVVHPGLSQHDPTLPGMHTLATLSLRDADSLLGFAERLYDKQTSVDAGWALRRIDLHRRLLNLPLSISAMHRRFSRSTQRGEPLQRHRMQANVTARHSVANWVDCSMQQLAR